jgi:hypothetical protein
MWFDFEREHKGLACYVALWLEKTDYLCVRESASSSVVYCKSATGNDNAIKPTLNPNNMSTYDPS